MGKIIISLLLSFTLLASEGLTFEFEEDHWDFSGELQSTVFVAPEARDEFSHEGHFRPTINFSTKGIVFSLKGEAVAKESADGAIDRLSEEEKRWLFNAKEASVSFSDGPVTLSVGKQVLDWSVTDTVSPSDLLSPFDLERPIDRERIGIFSVILKVGDEEKFSELVFVPKVTPSRLPQGNWNLFPEDVLVAKQEVDSQPQIAFRGKYLWQDFDLGVIYYHGIAFSPNARGEKTLTGFVLVPFYDQLDAGVVSVSKELLGFIVRAEVGYFDHETGDDFFSYVVSLDREFYEVFREEDSLYFLLQYSDQVVSSESQAGFSGWIDFRRIFDNSLTATFVYQFSEESEWELNGEWAHSIDTGSGYAEVEVSKEVHFEKTSMEVKVGADFFYGPEETFWGGYEDEQLIYAGVSFHF